MGVATALAKNVTPVRSVDDAVALCLPIDEPSVQVVLTSPSAPLVDVAGEALPSCGFHVTVTPATGFPN